MDTYQNSADNLLSELAPPKSKERLLQDHHNTNQTTST